MKKLILTIFIFTTITANASWSYSTGLLTSSGATEASPDSLLAGISIVQTADATRGYSNGLVAWLSNVEVRSGGSFIKIDNDSQIELRGSSYIRPTNGGVNHGYRSTLILNTNSSRIDNALDFQNGSSLIALKERPNDPSAKILYKNTARHDYPNIQSGSSPAKMHIQGLDLYNVSATANSYLKLYFGKASFSNISAVRSFNSLGVINVQVYSTTYNDSYSESLGFPSEAINNNIIYNRPTFYTATPSPINESIRSSSVTLNNPTFLNNCWNGTCDFNDSNSNNKLFIKYSYTNVFKSGTDNLESVNVLFSRKRESVNGSPTWTAPESSANATTDINGTYTPIFLTDAYREGASFTNIERFNWTAKARKYNKKTAAENVFENRILYKHSVSMSSGYSEEVQMLQVPYLTLTEAQANALTGINFLPSGVTGGTVTISGARTVADLWQYYRAWVSKIANFGSNDTWSYDGTNLNIGLWTITGIENLSGGTITTSVATANGAFSIEVVGVVNQATPTNLPTTAKATELIYNTSTPTTVIYGENTNIGKVSNNGTATVTISGGSITDYTDAEINYLDSNLTAVGVTSATIYQTANNRDTNTNAGATFTIDLTFKYGSVVNGVTMSGTIYLRVVVGSITLLSQLTLATGQNVLDLGVQGQLSSINSKVETVKINLPIINRNVIKASKLIPASEITQN